MSYLVTTSYANNREIAQGETLPIFLTIKPTKTDFTFDEVWAETDEGYVTPSLHEPPFSQVLQLVYSSDDTIKFTPGEHHVRIWAKDNSARSVLLEFMLTVNPGFPFKKETLNKDYVYTGNNIVTYNTDGEAELLDQPSYNVKQVNPAQWAARVIDVDDQYDLPTEFVQVGDIARVHVNPLQYFICVSLDPVVWLRMANDPFDTHNLLVAGEDFVHLDCQPTFESEVE